MLKNIKWGCLQLQGSLINLYGQQKSFKKIKKACNQIHSFLVYIDVGA